MTSPHDIWTNPLATRYASPEMARVFSDRFRIGMWRRLWLELARAQKRLGLKITDKQLREMERHLDEIDFDAAGRIERELRHDVMSHIRVFAEQCPSAGPIIHLGATSQFVNDNAELVQMREGLKLVRLGLAGTLDALSHFARKHKGLPTLGFTHYQPAQLTTVGKRAALWANDLAMDLDDISRLVDWLPLRGAKGTTGTQASFLKLFDGDAGKVRKLDAAIARAFGFKRTVPIGGQTYSRKIDSTILDALSGVAQSASKFAHDMRLLANLGEMEEPFEAKQVGSSAMAYKRNPMRSERICALARFAIVDALNPAITAATQWFERTLDDSANRRLAIAQSFLAVDGILRIYRNVAEGLVVNEKVIRKHVDEQIEFMATENLMMEATARGGDRQALHEVIRQASHEVMRIRKDGGEASLFDRLREREEFAGIDFKSLADPARYVGLAPEQTAEFLKTEITPRLRPLRKELSGKSELNV